MHYRNGREAKNGDKVVQLGWSGGNVEAVGELQNATPGSDFCNGDIMRGAEKIAGACLCDCLHVDDLAAILAENGLDKRPEVAADNEGTPPPPEEQTGALPEDEPEEGAAVESGGAPA